MKKKKKVEKISEEEQSKLDEFMGRVFVFVDRNGIVMSKNSTPMSCSLSMKYDQKDLRIKMSAFAHGMGNGSCSAKVVYKGETVYNADGSYTSGPWGRRSKDT